jgi:hypothetical protein
MDAHTLAFKTMQQLNGVKFMYNALIPGAVDAACRYVREPVPQATRDEAADLVRAALKRFDATTTPTWEPETDR